MIKSKDESAFDQKGTRTARLISQRIRREWRELWDKKIEDKLVAEYMARKDYELLFLERGTVIRATKDFQPPDLQEILERNEKLLGVKITYPDPAVGGWKKFAKDVLSKQPRYRTKPVQSHRPKEKVQNGSQRKGGRGWLNKR